MGMAKTDNHMQKKNETIPLLHMIYKISSQ